MSTEVESLDSIFDNAEPPAVAEVKETSRDESGRFAVVEDEKPAEETKPAEAVKPQDAAQPPVKEPVRPEVAAIIDERKKRQQAERERDELRAKAEPKPDFWADPEKATEATVRKFVDPIKEENFRLRMELAESRYPDFPDAVQAFLEAAQNDSTLAFQVDHAPDPIAFAYREGKRLKELAPYGGDFTKYAEGVTGQLKGELTKSQERIKALEAELAAAQKAKAELETVPRSLNKGTESAPRSRAEADDDDIKNIVRFK